LVPIIAVDLTAHTLAAGTLVLTGAGIVVVARLGDISELTTYCGITCDLSAYIAIVAIQRFPATIPVATQVFLSAKITVITRLSVVFELALPERQVTKLRGAFVPILAVFLWPTLAITIITFVID